MLRRGGFAEGEDGLREDMRRLVSLLSRRGLWIATLILIVGVQACN
jgi:hypothetical protein